MNNTTHYSLKKPEDTDFYNIDDFNDNSDSIDTLIYEKSEGAPEKTTPAGTDFLQLIGAADDKVYKTLVRDIAKHIVETYAGSTIAGSAQTIKDAIDSLNSRTGSVSITAIRNSNISTGFCAGFYDKATGTVRLIVYFSSTANIEAGTNIFTIPDRYRPAGVRAGAGVLITSNGGSAVYQIRTNAAGDVYQEFGNLVRSGFGYLEYSV